MKTKIFYTLTLLFFSFISTELFAQKTATASIKVFGNCGMCKMRIQTALDYPGIKTAEWSPETKNLEVVYNTKKIDELKIHKLVASVGHDTDKVKAKDEVYAKLPFCCLYRDHDHSGMKDDDHHGH